MAMVWPHAFLTDALLKSTANLYSPITDVWCDAELVHEDSMAYTVKNSVTHKRVVVLSVKKRFTTYVVFKYHLQLF